MRPLSVPQRVASIRTHLREIRTARDHGDPIRASHHSAIIEDHLYEIEKDMETLRLVVDRIAKP